MDQSHTYILSFNKFPEIQLYLLNPKIHPPLPYRYVLTILCSLYYQRIQITSSLIGLKVMKYLLYYFIHRRVI